MKTTLLMVLCSAAILASGCATSRSHAIAKVVIKTRQHLAAIKPQQQGLMLELMHFPQELVDVAEIKAPKHANAGAKEMNMAKQLVQSMASDWKPDTFKDDYREAVEKMIQEKITHGEAHAPRARKKTPKTIDLVSVLQRSIKEAKTQQKKRPPSERRKLAA